MSTDHHNEEVTVTVTLSRDELLAAMQANKPAPRSTTQQSADAGSKFARPNSPRQHAAARPAWMAQPASEAQFAGLRSRLEARKGVTEAEDIRNALNQAMANKSLDKGMASEFITRLDLITPNPVVTAPQAPVAAPRGPVSGDEAWKRPNCVQDGQYALKGDDDVIRFYSVNTNGGICWVAIHASDERHNIKGRLRHQILDAIAVDPMAAAVLFGHETNHCGRCGRELTDEVSRANGIGPKCAKAMGWA